MPIEYLHPRVADRPTHEPAYAADVTPIVPRVVRCTCEQCGAHTNAVWTFRIGGACPTCGSYRLAPLEGAELMDAPPFSPDATPADQRYETAAPLPVTVA